MRKIRVLIGIFGLDQHEVGALSVARMLIDGGMEVIYAGRFNTPSKLMRIAVQEDVDVIGVSCHSWEYIDYTPELMELMKKEGVDIPVVLGGSVITPADELVLKNLGIAAVFGPGAAREDIIATISELGARNKNTAG
ncbi:cobalamin B12-binding domain-containing protein [Desulfotruncus alcoholivorax]|uniref:cobalamin B12-binding domain-containing protein n=1 Tax=Desulfotruncus alcoholivorax TaxID=265477 RepID=UPI0004021580|nr:cobalamin-dependent protein [Desulfotruncus alcoholivorax]